MTFSRLVASLSVASSLCLGGCNAAVEESSNANSAAIAEFERRVDAYVKLHDEAAGRNTAEAQSSAAEMQAQRDALRTRISERRASAQPGDIFTPEVSTAFRQLLNPEVRGAGASGTRSAIREGGPKEFSLKPNAPYPEDESFATVPANVLAVLPRLPVQLEYRMVDNHLILRDIQANIVVDYMFDVMCANC